MQVMWSEVNNSNYYVTYDPNINYYVTYDPNITTM